MAAPADSTSDEKNYANLANMGSTSEEEEEDEHFVLPNHLRLRTNYDERKDGRIDCCPAQLYAILVSLFVLFSAVCALTGYTYYVHARLDAMQTICTQLDLLGQNGTVSALASLSTLKRAEDGGGVTGGFLETLLRNISLLQSQMRRVMTSSGTEANDAAAVSKTLQSLDERVEALESSAEGVQTDIRQLNDDRENIRSTFNDLTLKLINNHEMLVLTRNESSTIAGKLSLVERLLASHNATNRTAGLYARLRSADGRLQTKQSNALVQLKSVLNTMSLSLTHLMDRVQSDAKELRRSVQTLSRRLSSVERRQALVNDVVERLDTVERAVRRLSTAAAAPGDSPTQQHSETVDDGKPQSASNATERPGSLEAGRP